MVRLSTRTSMLMTNETNIWALRGEWHPTPVCVCWKIPWTEEPGGLQSMGSLSQTRLNDFTFTFHFHALDKEMAAHSSVLAWRLPGTGEAGGLPSMGSHRVRHDWSNLAERRMLLISVNCFSEWHHLLESIVLFPYYAFGYSILGIHFIEDKVSISTNLDTLFFFQ